MLVAVDGGGADALIEEGWTPDVIVGDMDSVSTRRCAAARDPRARLPRRLRPGEARLRRLGVARTVAAPRISEDIALLLAHDKGAELIVAVGTHFNLVEFLERSRAGMSSTFVTQLKVGEISLTRRASPVSSAGRSASAARSLRARRAGAPRAILASPALRNVFGL